MSVLDLVLRDILFNHLQHQLTFLLFGLLVTDREADRDSSMEDVAISITAMIQKRSKGLTALIQEESLLKVHQVLPTRLIVTTQDMLHQCLFLKDTKRVSKYCFQYDYSLWLYW